MKKKIYSIATILLLVTLLFAVFGGVGFLDVNHSIVSADSVAIANDETGIPDFYLYEGLLANYNAGKPINEQKSSITSDMFSLTSSLDLSDRDISQLTGLNLLDFGSLTTLDLSGNKIETLGSTLTEMPALTGLNLSNNELYSFSATNLHSSVLTTLSSLNLSHNAFTSSINLSGFTIVNADLTFCVISNQNNITFPTEATASVNLSHNMLLGLDITNETCQIIGGLQGINASHTYNTSVEIGFYGLPECSTITVLKNGETVATLLENQNVILSVGVYTIHLSDTPSGELYQDITITVRPEKPVVTLEDGTTIDLTTTISTETTYYFTGVEGAEFSYSLSVNGVVTTGTGTEVTVDTAGIVILKVRQTISGITSEYATYWINVNYVSSWGWVFVVLGIAIFALIFYFARWAVVKYIYKIPADKTNKDNLK